MAAPRLDKLRQQLRMTAAQALAQGATRADLAADLMCAARGVGAPGGREYADAEEVASMWADLDTYARPPDWGPAPASV